MESEAFEMVKDNFIYLLILIIIILKNLLVNLNFPLTAELVFRLVQGKPYGLGKLLISILCWQTLSLIWRVLCQE